MTGSPDPPVERLRLRISLRTVLLWTAFALAAVLTLYVLTRSRRVAGWLLTATVLAGLLEPAVDLLAKVMRRGFALALVAVVTLLSLAAIGYGVVNDLVGETRQLQRAAPREVAKLEQSERFGELVREYELVERTERIVDEIPNAFLGPTPAATVRGVTARAATALIVTVLSLFLLSRRRRVVAAALKQIRDDDRRARMRAVSARAYARGFGYLRGTVGLAAVGGVLAYALGVAADVPGAAPLGIWAALWDLLPVLGAFVGFAPLVALAALNSPVAGALVLVAVLAHQIAEGVVRSRWLEPRTLRLGPFLTALALYAGLELGGVFGALVLFAVAAVGAAVVDEVTTPSI